MHRLLTQGIWTRPTDKMAVYTEIAPGEVWGIRVTLYHDTAQVEAINGPKCTWYKAPSRVSAKVTSPTFWEKLRGISFQDKLMAEVTSKRTVAQVENSKLQNASSTHQPPTIG
jgi:hypothetical protein